MTEFALTLLRLAFLGALWLFVIITVVALRRDLVQPRDARPTSTRTAKPPKPVKPPKAPKPPKKSSGGGPALVVTDGPLANTVKPSLQSRNRSPARASMTDRSGSTGWSPSSAPRASRAYERDCPGSTSRATRRWIRMHPTGPRASTARPRPSSR